MQYSPYLKSLGMTRMGFFKLKHFGIRNELERFKFGTSYHEMWVLDILLCCEIYVRLKHMHERYHYVCNFADKLGDNIQSHSINQFSDDNDYSEEADRRYKEVLNSLEYVIKSYCGEDTSDKYEVCSDEWKEFQNRIQQGFKYLGEGLWGVGI